MPWRHSGKLEYSHNPQLLYDRGNCPITHQMGDWVGSGACLDMVAKRKNLIITLAGHLNLA